MSQPTKSTKTMTGPAKLSGTQRTLATATTDIQQQLTFGTLAPTAQRTLDLVSPQQELSFGPLQEQPRRTSTLDLIEQFHRGNNEEEKPSSLAELEHDSLSEHVATTLPNIFPRRNMASHAVQFQQQEEEGEELEYGILPDDEFEADSKNSEESSDAEQETNAETAPARTVTDVHAMLAQEYERKQPSTNRQVMLKFLETMEQELDPSLNKKDLVLHCIDKLTEEEAAMELFFLQHGRMSNRFTATRIPVELNKECLESIEGNWAPEKLIRKYRQENAEEVESNSEPDDVSHEQQSVGSQSADHQQVLDNLKKLHVDNSAFIADVQRQAEAQQQAIQLQLQRHQEAMQLQINILMETKGSKQKCSRA